MPSVWWPRWPPCRITGALRLHCMSAAVMMSRQHLLLGVCNRSACAAAAAAAVPTSAGVTDQHKQTAAPAIRLHVIPDRRIYTQFRERRGMLKVCAEFRRCMPDHRCWLLTSRFQVLSPHLTTLNFRYATSDRAICISSRNIVVAPSYSCEETQVLRNRIAILRVA